MLSALEDALRQNPLSWEAVLAYHSAAIACDEFSRAEKTLRGVLAACPKHKRLQFLLIDLLLKQHKHAAAMAGIESAMADFGIDDGILAAALTVRAKLGVHFGQRKAGSRVSLCMIVKNEEEHLARCLHSAKPVVDEIIIADTGSKDRSPDIARAFGALVFSHPWENDFAEARNTALAKAKGDWILVLDGDEALSVRDHECFRQIVEGQLEPRVAYTIQTRNYTFQVNTVGWQLNDGSYPAEEAGVGWFPSEKVRLFPNDPGIRFTYPVHEVVEPSLKNLGIAIQSCRIPVHHYGKLREDRTRRKTASYQALGRRKLGMGQDDPTALREAAIQASHLGHHEEALKLWQQFARIRPDSGEAFINMGSASFNLRRYAEAVAFAEKAIALDPSLKEAHFNLAIAYLMLGCPDRAISILGPLANRAPDYPAAGFLLAASHACMGSVGVFKESLRRLGASPLGAYLSISISDLAERLLDAGQRGYALQLLQSAANQNYAHPKILSLLKACQQAA
jgi:tetratricopeptide (TPR) repeat protein